MQHLMIGILKGDFSLQLYLAVIVFLFPLNKKHHYSIWLCAELGLCFFLRMLFSVALPFPEVLRYGGLLLTLGTCIFVFWLCAEVTVWDAVFGVTCAYAAQHLAYSMASILIELFHMSEVAESLTTTLLFLGVLVLSYYTVAKRITVNGAYITSSRETVIAMLLLLVFAFPLSAQLSSLYSHADRDLLPLYIIGRLYGIVCCFFILWVETMMVEKLYIQAELSAERKIRAAQEEQYLLSKENIELINRKCHDLKHQIAAFRQITSDERKDRFIDEMQQAVMIYDAVAETGNPALDTILTERSLTCEKERVVWTCMADGSVLDFMDPVDLYTLFGNALDNALESVRQIEDTEKRQISVRVARKDQMALMNISNYYAGLVAMKNGLPQTKKADRQNHGFGVRSIVAIVEKYGGCVSIDTENQIFSLSILIPIP